MMVLPVFAVYAVDTLVIDGRTWPRSLCSGALLSWGGGELVIWQSAGLLFELMVSAIEITPEALRVRSNSCLMKLLGSSDS